MSLVLVRVLVHTEHHQAAGNTGNVLRVLRVVYLSQGTAAVITGPGSCILYLNQGFDRIGF